MTTKEVTVKVRLSARLAARLARLAKKKGVTKSAALREAIEISEREQDRQDATRELIAQAEEDQRRLKGRRPPSTKFELR